ncbi:MAG TPA: DUF1326 domain-containing protein [Candidatus Binataceae bacterium]|nr:DUF1326 domain-containing protein [Candidatus Binataceae bacterium]
MSESWSLKGSYFETCNCETACPCVFLSPPTEGDCTVLLAWHVDEGRFGDIPLKGLNVALAVYSPGHMAKVKWKAGLYLDERASGEQREALTKIFSGQAGGHLGRVAQHIGEVLGVRSVSIEYRAEGKRRSVRVGNVADAAIQAIEGPAGEVAVSGHPLAIAPGFPAIVSRSEKLHYQDHGYSWEISERNGFYSPFQYANG